jgi:hypothetical protein
MSDCNELIKEKIMAEEDKIKAQLDKQLENTYKEMEEQEKRIELSTLQVFKFINVEDKIVGILLELTTIPTQYGQSPFAKIKTEGGVYGIFLPYELKQTITSELIGEKLEIIFKGFINTKSGRQMKKFNVARIIRKKEEVIGMEEPVNGKNTELMSF